MRARKPLNETRKFTMKNHKKILKMRDSCGLFNFYLGKNARNAMFVLLSRVKETRGSLYFIFSIVC